VALFAWAMAHSRALGRRMETAATAGSTEWEHAHRAVRGSEGPGKALSDAAINRGAYIVIPLAVHIPAVFCREPSTSEAVRSPSSGGWTAVASDSSVPSTLEAGKLRSRESGRPGKSGIPTSAGSVWTVLARLM